jgi:hypothetical protein
MKARLITGAVLGLLLSVCVPAQQVTQGITQGSSETGVSANSQTTFKEEVTHRIALAEAGLRQAESRHVSDVELARLYGQIGLMYEDVGQMVRAEAMLSMRSPCFVMPLSRMKTLRPPSAGWETCMS